MRFTFRNNVWKSDTTNIIVPKNSRPFTNVDPELEHHPRTPMKANPIKHWRKQLQPYYENNSKQVSIDQINAPNSAIHVGSKHIDCTSGNNKLLLKENIALLNNCVGTKIDGVCVGGSYTVRRSASTIIKKNYYTSNRNYLKAKCKTYDKNIILGDKNLDGTYKSPTCDDPSSNCNKKIIYKPTNRTHSQQGAVSASGNLLRKRNNTLAKNSHSLKNEYGSGYANQIPRYTNSSESAHVLRYIKGKGEINTACNCNQ